MDDGFELQVWRALQRLDPLVEAYDHEVRSLLIAALTGRWLSTYPAASQEAALQWHTDSVRRWVQQVEGSFNA